MKRTILIFGSLAAAIFILFELNKLSFWNFGDNSNVFIVLSGVLFIVIGYLISRYLPFNHMNKVTRTAKNSELSRQEHRVLLLISEGYSNHEIAEHLFIAESTVKAHVSNILSKLKAKRRTEAIKIGRDLEII